MVPKVIILKSKRSSTFILLVNPLGNVVIHILKKKAKNYIMSKINLVEKSDHIYSKIPMSLFVATVA